MQNDMTPQRPRRKHLRSDVRPATSPGRDRAASARPSADVPPQTPKRQRPGKTIEIRLLVPHLGHHPLVKRTAARFARTGRKQRIMTVTAAVLLIGAGVYTIFRPEPASTAIVTSTENPLDKLQKGTPDYPTLLPEGKSIKDLGGWTRISPPERDPVYAYVDKIGTVAISVSQQPLPQSFAQDPDGKVKALAAAQSADKTVTIDGKKAYIGTSTNGPQSVIYSTDKLLILLKSSSVISDAEWQKYIQSLG